jgi:ABC-type multidrug transport system fused ATPase/permease subunit
MANAWAGLQEGRASLDRLQNWRPADFPALAVVPTTPRATPVLLGRHAPEVAADDLTFRYASGHTVLEGMTFRIPAAALTVVTGPNGSGKSTLAKLLLAFYAPVRGVLTWDGVAFEDLGAHWIRSRTLYMNQEPFLIPGSVSDNLRIGLDDVTDLRMEEALASVGLPADGAFRARDVGERGKALSGGQRVRLAMARSLVREASLVVMDEPTAAVDAEGRAAVVDILGRLRQQRTVLVITHDPVLVAAADHVVALSREPLAAGSLPMTRALTAPRANRREP